MNDTRRKILDAALAEFSERGFETATVARIRTRSGVSNGSFFHFFRSKAAVAEALHMQAVSDYQEGLARLLGKYPGRAEKAVREAVAFHLEWVRAHPLLAGFMLEPGPPGTRKVRADEVRQANLRMGRAIQDWAVPLQESGRLKPFPPEVLSACLIGPAQIVCRAWLNGLSPVPPTAYRDVLADAAWASVGVTPVQEDSHDR